MINKVICKRSHSGSIIPFITVDRIKIDNPDKIANSFGKFYSTLGSRLALEITEGQYKTEDYLKKIPKNINSMMLLPTTQEEVQQIIDLLPAKSSSGHDDASNVLLKSLKNSLTYSLTLIFNQSLSERIFPDKMKLAEVIPLYKNKALDHLVNYRPISLLMTMSKVLEKLVYKRVVSFINNHDILYRSQYGCQNQHSCEQAVQKLLGKILQARKDGHKTASIYMDLSKAFDTLDHGLLLVENGMIQNMWTALTLVYKLPTGMIFSGKSPRVP